ncbi:hypothetical protein ACGFJ5_05545 [Micromonospora echinaurantiaca]|uniref:hypothetical protein n=1 Tax=Micromonospora echinaurantiaca TaxID=47857 RepID=UPI0037143015
MTVAPLRSTCPYGTWWKESGARRAGRPRAAYNQYGAGNGRPAAPERDLHVYPFNGHEGGEAVQVRRQRRWLAGVLGH